MTVGGEREAEVVTGVEMFIGWWRALALISAMIAMVLPGSAPAQERLPIFDAHMHYSAEAWGPYGAQTVLEKMVAAGVPRALVSSTPDDGTLKLYKESPDRIVPELRPYHDGVGPSTWFADPGVPGYIKRRLQRGIYVGIGEFHLFDESQAESPHVRRIVEMAVERGLILHVHSDDGPIRALFEIEPGLRILWAHAGFTSPPEVVGALLDTFPGLSAEVSFRGRDIAPGGILDPRWRDIFERLPDRFLIGTDTYANGRWDRYQDLVEEHRVWLEQLSPREAEAIAFRNAVGLFGDGGLPELQRAPPAAESEDGEDEDEIEDEQEDSEEDDGDDEERAEPEDTDEQEESDDTEDDEDE